VDSTMSLDNNSRMSLLDIHRMARGLITLIFGTKLPNLKPESVYSVENEEKQPPYEG
jgi:hypothetical protein